MTRFGNPNFEMRPLNWREVTNYYHREITSIPMAHKDIFCTKGITTTCGSRMLSNFVFPYDATVVEKFNAADPVTLGKTDIDEFAIGSSNASRYFR